ncbi:MAG: hypothetical protein KDA90_18530, partial [Planctomycetaceae bacterium]|nr:hypothetical protein [Planctomycetaceae bacterium]
MQTDHHHIAAPGRIGDSTSENCLVRHAPGTQQQGSFDLENGPQKLTPPSRRRASDVRYRFPTQQPSGAQQATEPTQKKPATQSVYGLSL